MFGSISKKEHDIALFQAYERGYDDAATDFRKARTVNQVLLQAISMIASAEEGDDLESSMRSTAQKALNWTKANAPELLRPEKPLEKPEDSEE